MTTATAWQQVEPISGAGPVTLFRGGTFLITGADGLVRCDPHGFYHDDVRLLDGVGLDLIGEDLEVLSTRVDGPARAHTAFRARPGRRQESEVVVSLTWSLAPGRLVAAVTLRNLTSSPRATHWRLSLSGDFTSMFAVKEGRFEAGNLSAVTADGDTLRMQGRGREVHVTCPGALARVDGFSEQVDVPPRGEVRREVVVQVPGCAAEVAAAMTTIPHWPNVRHRDRRRGALIATGLSDLAGLRMVDPETGCTTIAAGAPWFMALFGRDSLLTSLMALPWWPALAAGTLQALAARQGQVADAVTEEQPGRILHETRLSGGSPMFHGGGSVYYGSTDATPLFVVLLAEAWRWGLPDDEVRTLLPAADAALEWCRRYGDVDGDGLIESIALSRHGLVNQGWKDSWNGIPDDLGAPVRTPMSLIEVQGYWYAALAGRADIARSLGDDDTAAGLAQEASRLRRRIDDGFWLADGGRYALALDPDKRPARALASNAGHLLWTGAALPQRVPRLAAGLLSPRLRTAWGLRTLSDDHPAYNPMGYHVGSVWPHDTALVTWGLARWGYQSAATSMSEALFDVAGRLGRLPELFSGLSAADPVTDGSPVPYPTACSPQAWAAASPLLLLRAVAGLEVDVVTRRLRVAPQVAEPWDGLVWHGVQVGTHRVTVRAHRGRWQVAGVPAEWELREEPLYGEVVGS